MKVERLGVKRDLLDAGTCIMTKKKSKDREKARVVDVREVTEDSLEEFFRNHVATSGSLTKSIMA